MPVPHGTHARQTAFPRPSRRFGPRCRAPARRASGQASAPGTRRPSCATRARESNLHVGTVQTRQVVGS